VDKEKFIQYVKNVLNVAEFQATDFCKEQSWDETKIATAILDKLDCSQLPPCRALIHLYVLAVLTGGSQGNDQQTWNVGRKKANGKSSGGRGRGGVRGRGL